MDDLFNVFRINELAGGELVNDLLGFDALEIVVEEHVVSIAHIIDKELFGIIVNAGYLETVESNLFGVIFIVRNDIFHDFIGGLLGDLFAGDFIDASNNLTCLDLSISALVHDSVCFLNCLLLFLAKKLACN